MKTTNPVIKNFIMDIMVMSDVVDAKGQRVRRDTYPKATYKVAHDVIKKIEAQLECDVKKDGEVTTMLNKDYTQDLGERVSLKHTSSEIEFTEQEIKAIRGFYDERTDLISIPEAAFEEFSALISKNDK